MGLRTQTQNAAFCERKGPKRKPWPRGKSLSRKKMIAMRFLNASVLERKALNRNLSWGFPLGNLLLKTRVLKHRVLEHKRRPNANASVLGTLRFGTLGSARILDFEEKHCKNGCVCVFFGGGGREPEMSKTIRSRPGKLSCTRLRVPPVALHVSRYTCRSWFPGF